MKKLLFFLVSLSCASLWGQTADFSASPTTICVGGSVQFTDASTGATSWSWTFIDGGIGQSSSIPNPVITYSIPGFYTVILTVSNGISSDTEIKTAFIQVVNAASVTLTSAFGTENQTTCVGVPLSSPITYNVVGATGATITGLPAGVTGTFVPSGGGGTISINGTPSLTGTFNYTITTSGSNCLPVSVFGIITVAPSPTLSLTSLLGTDNQTVCANTGITPIIYLLGGSATSATISGLPAGVTASVVLGNVLITGTPTNPGVYNYSVITIGSVCLPITLSGTITVDALPTLTLSSSVGTNNQTVCQNTPINLLTYTLGGGATNAGVSGLPIGLTASVTAGVLSITGTPTVPGNYTLTINTLGGTCPAASTTATIQVDASPTISLISALGTNNQTVCINASITNIVYNIGGSATGATASGLPAGVTATFSAGQLTLAGTPTASGTFNYTVTTTGGTCVPASVSGAIQVNALPTIVLSSPIASDNQTICA